MSTFTFLVASTLYTSILISSSFASVRTSSDALLLLLLPFLIPISQLSGHCLHMQTLTSTQATVIPCTFYTMFSSLSFFFLSLVPGPTYSL
jgi:hypothetical protein